MIGVAIYCVENFTEVSLNEGTFAFCERIKPKPSKEFLVQDTESRDRTKKNRHPKSMPMLMEVMKNEVPLDGGEVTCVEDHVEKN